MAARGTGFQMFRMRIRANLAAGMNAQQPVAKFRHQESQSAHAARLRRRLILKNDRAVILGIPIHNIITAWAEAAKRQLGFLKRVAPWRSWLYEASGINS